MYWKRREIEIIIFICRSWAKANLKSKFLNFEPNFISRWDHESLGTLLEVWPILFRPVEHNLVSCQFDRNEFQETFNYQQSSWSGPEALSCWLPSGTSCWRPRPRLSSTWSARVCPESSSWSWCRLSTSSWRPAGKKTAPIRTKPKKLEALTSGH